MGTKVKRRIQKKWLARYVKDERRMLVHAAGCVYRGCSSRWFLDPKIFSDPECALMPGVSIPRSLRNVFGFKVSP